MTQSAVERAELVRVSFGLGTFELSAAESRQLARLLRRRGAEPGGDVARSAAARLEEAVSREAEPSEGELDAIADAAWAWLQEAGPGNFPDRVLGLLDAVRARHAHE